MKEAIDRETLPRGHRMIRNRGYVGIGQERFLTSTAGGWRWRLLAGFGSGCAS